MPAPSVTYTFSNSTTADATQVNQNFTDLVNGITDGTKDLSISALTCAGNVSFNGNVTLGNASGDDVTFTGSLASSIPIKTHNSFDIGSVTTLGLRALYFASSSATKTAKLQGPAVASDVTVTLPATTGTLGRNMASMTIQTLTSGTDATYTTPTGCVALRLRMVGGGGGGGGSCTSAANNGSTGGTGGSTIWKTSGGTAMITCAGGAGGGGTSQAFGGSGGTVTVASGTTIFTRQGSQGESTQESGAASVNLGGRQGAGTPFGGGGMGGPSVAAGASPIANTGAGGGGGGAPATGIAGAGGGAGGYAEMLITSPASTYLYTIGAVGAAGSAGTSGFAGGAGSDGFIVVEEYY